MREHPKYRTGNVVIDPNGRLAIVYDVRECENHEDGKKRDRYYATMPLDYANCKGGFWETAFKRDKQCFCYEGNDGQPYDECGHCNGEGSYESEIKGASESRYLADTVKEYILKRLTKNFEWK